MIALFEPACVKLRAYSINGKTLELLNKDTSVLQIVSTWCCTFCMVGFGLKPRINVNPPEPKGSKDPNNRGPFQGVVGGYIGTYGDYLGGPRTQIIGF